MVKDQASLFDHMAGQLTKRRQGMQLFYWLVGDKRGQGHALH